MTYIQHYLDSLNLEALGLSLITRCINLVLFIIVWGIFKRLTRHVAEKIHFKSDPFAFSSEARQRTLTKLFQNVWNYSLYFILIYAVLAILGLPISSLLAGAGIAGLAIGLGAQGFLTDVVNGVFILMERQYDVGDTVKIQTVTGTVSDVGIRSTQIRDQDGSLHFIPNRNITLVSNLSRGPMRAQIDLPVPMDADLDKISQTIAQINASKVPQFPEILAEPIIQGARTSTTGQPIFRVDIQTQNGKQGQIYYHFYHLYQDALRRQGLLSERPLATEQQPTD
ncbi:mechanosensitive ion channel family protein [Streptococcus caprae]|uniref:Mechanosensitive ion channel family protein n=1 Tax=Streptococcus caprae TaxID=1640501 RepID=A0ABV8CU72_9STRE